MKTYRGIVIGCGKIGVSYEADAKRPRPRSHAGALAGNSRTELSALVGASERDKENASRFFPGTPFYADAVDALRNIRPDIAIIAASTDVHFSLAALCTKERVPILIGEKPLAPDMRTALEIKRITEESGSVFALNYQRRYFPLFRKAKECLADGELGAIQEVLCMYDNGLFNNGGHAIDTLMFLLDARMTAAKGIVRANNTTHPMHDPNIDGEITTNEGTKVILKSFDQKATPIHELRLVGEKGSLRIADYGYLFEWNIGGVMRQERDERTMTGDVLADAIAAYEGKRAPQSNVENGINTLAVLEALKESSEHGGSTVGVAV